MSLGSGSLEEKLLAVSYAATKRVVSPSFKFSSSAPSVNVKVVKLQDCEEECDCLKREAKIAIRFTDLGSWDSSSPRYGGENTDSDPKTIQHWALVVHFPRGKKTYLFEAWKDEKTGLLQAGRAEGVDYEVFEKAKNFSTIETCPSELLEKAKQVYTGQYSAIFNNCQTWVKGFCNLYSLSLLGIV